LKGEPLPKFFCRKGLQWRKATFVNYFLPKLSSFIDWCCYYIQVSYTGSWEPLVFVIFINFFGQLKDWVGQVLFLVSCPKGQVEKYVNVEACHPVCSFSFMLHAKWRSNKYQFYSLWFDPIRAWTHDLLHSQRWARYQLHHRCGLTKIWVEVEYRIIPPCCNQEQKHCVHKIRHFSSVALLFDQWIIFKNLQLNLFFLCIWTLTFYYFRLKNVSQIFWNLWVSNSC
jgi:hypothetical protein